MALIATPGAVDANSYSTLVKFNAYQLEQVFPKGAGTTDGQKEAALITATRNFDAHFRWKGTPTFPDVPQALGFPRTGLYYQGIPVNPLTIPLQLEIATNEYAGLLLTTDPSVPNDVQVQGIKKVKASSVEVEFTGEGKFDIISPYVLSLIPPEWYEGGITDVSGSRIIFRNL
jgi:hypothetical protein